MAMAVSQLPWFAPIWNESWWHKYIVNLHQKSELYVRKVQAMDATHITRDGSRVTLRSIPTPRYPAAVMVQSATTLARVPASVERRPPLYVPRERRDDITLDRRERFTPAFANKIRDLVQCQGETYFKKCIFVYLQELLQKQMWQVLRQHTGQQSMYS